MQSHKLTVYFFTSQVLAFILADPREILFSKFFVQTTVIQQADKQHKISCLSSSNSGWLFVQCFCAEQVCMHARVWQVHNRMPICAYVCVCFSSCNCVCVCVCVCHCKALASIHELVKQCDQGMGFLEIHQSHRELRCWTAYSFADGMDSSHPHIHPDLWCHSRSLQFVSRPEPQCEMCCLHRSDGEKLPVPCALWGGAGWVSSERRKRKNFFLWYFPSHHCPQGDKSLSEQQNLLPDLNFLLVYWCCAGTIFLCV